MITKLRLWLEEWMNIILMSFGTIFLTASFGCFIESQHKDTVSPCLFLILSLVLFAIGLIFYIVAIVITWKKERKENEERRIEAGVRMTEHKAFMSTQEKVFLSWPEGHIGKKKDGEE